MQEKTTSALKPHCGINNPREAETKLFEPTARNATDSKQTSKRLCCPTCQSPCTFTPSEASFRAQTSWISTHGRLFAAAFAWLPPAGAEEDQQQQQQLVRNSGTDTTAGNFNFENGLTLFMVEWITDGSPLCPYPNQSSILILLIFFSIHAKALLWLYCDILYNCAFVALDFSSMTSINRCSMKTGLCAWSPYRFSVRVTGGF